MSEFGQHVTIDASGCIRKRLMDYSFVYDILNKLPSKINMHKMILPYVVKWLDPGATIEGISGFVMIAESHISIHTFPEKDYVFIDVFSCRNFDTDKAIKLIVNAFGAKKYTTEIVPRGKDFPRANSEHIYETEEQLEAQ